MNPSSIFQIPDNEVSAVPKDFFVDGLELIANVYLKINANHYMLIGKKGTPSAISQYHVITKQDTELFVKTCEYPEVVSSNFNFTEKVMNNGQINSNTKVRYLNALSDSVVTDLFSFGIGVGTVDNLKRLGNFVQDAVSDVEAIDDILGALATLPNNMAKHAMSTAFLSLLIAQEMNITVKAALEKLVLGSLIHDIGLREIPTEILEKPRLLWTEAEIQYYESHPSRGVEILREIPQISNDVLLIVNEHHENSLGLGFPRRIRDIKISPLSRIVALADYTTDLMYGHFTQAKSKTLDDVVSYIQMVMGQPFNKPAFLALKSLTNKQNLINKKSS